MKKIKFTVKLKKIKKDNDRIHNENCGEEREGKKIKQREEWKFVKHPKYINNIYNNKTKPLLLQTRLCHFYHILGVRNFCLIFRNRISIVNNRFVLQVTRSAVL